MMKTWGILLWAGTTVAMAAEPLTLKWSELAAQATGKKVEMVLPGGTSVKGKVRAVDATGLQLDISKTSDKHLLPKGLHTIPRQSVWVLRVTEYRKAGRLVGTVGALAAAAAVTAYAARNTGLTDGSAVVVIPAAGAVGTAGLGVAGYFIGKAMDKRVTEIRIAPGE